MIIYTRYSHEVNIEPALRLWPDGVPYVRVGAVDIAWPGGLQQAIAELSLLLSDARRRSEPVQQPPSKMAQCNACGGVIEDGEPTLYVKKGEDGALYAYCGVGCIVDHYAASEYVPAWAIKHCCGG